MIYSASARRTLQPAGQGGLLWRTDPAQLRGKADPDFQVSAAGYHKKRLPHQLPSDALPEPTMTLTACPGEYESASFGIFALQNLNGIKVTASDLIPAGTVPASALDLRVVKSGTGWAMSDSRI